MQKLFLRWLGLALFSWATSQVYAQRAIDVTVTKMDYGAGVHWPGPQPSKSQGLALVSLKCRHPVPAWKCAKIYYFGVDRVLLGVSPSISGYAFVSPTSINWTAGPPRSLPEDVPMNLYFALPEGVELKRVERILFVLATDTMTKVKLYPTGDLGRYEYEEKSAAQDINAD
jgi:hypothetical protein